MQLYELSGLFSLFAILTSLLSIMPAMIWPKKAGTLTQWAAIFSLGLLTSSWLILEFTAYGRLDWSPLGTTTQPGPGLFLNRLALSFGSLVALLSWVVNRYATRYLADDAIQTRFFIWSQATVSAVLLMILANHFLLVWFAWCATGLGLHQLLRLHKNRPEARRTATHKFIISRLGDLALLGAAYFIWKEFGTFHLPELLAKAESAGPAINVIGILLVIGALTRSAQVPFHAWLPETIDTPTPVSALMHAGIINAGGYLVLRMLPLISPAALSLLCLIGFLSITIAGLTMLATPDVKRQLALSTSAQMGFMFVQIGFGLPTAGLVHMLAHAFYKANCFLSSGELSRYRQHLANWSWGGPLATASVLAAALLPLIALSLYPSPDFTMGQTAALALFILTLGSSLLLHGTLAPTRGHILSGAILLPCLGTAMLFASHQLGQVLLPKGPWPYSSAESWALLLTSFGSMALFVLQRNLASWPENRRWALLTHARHGFYFNAIGQRFLRKLTHV